MTQKTSDIKSKCFTTSDYNKFPNNILDATIKEKSLFMNLKDSNTSIKSRN